MSEQGGGAGGGGGGGAAPLQGRQYRHASPLTTFKIGAILSKLFSEQRDR